MLRSRFRALSYDLGRPQRNRKGPAPSRKEAIKSPLRPSVALKRPYAQDTQRELGRPLAASAAGIGDVTRPPTATPAGKEDGDG